MTLLRVCGFPLALLIGFGCTDETPAAVGDAGTGPGPGHYELGAFDVDLTEAGGLTVTRRSEQAHVLFELERDFVELWTVTDTVAERGGSFTISEQVGERCTAQGETEVTLQGDKLSLATPLTCAGGVATATLTFEPKSERALGFSLEIEPAGDAELGQAVLVLPVTESERFVGFGEQFSHVNLRGKTMPIIVQEGGIGRAKGTVADQIEELSKGSGGTFYSSYAPMPFMFSDRGRALLLENAELSFFDLTGKNAARVRVRGLAMRGRVLAGQTPLEIITSLTEFTGRMSPLPDWMGEGVIIGMQGGSDRVRTVQSALEAAQVKVAAYWLQDWVGKRSTVLGSRLWWNWQLNPLQYPAFDDLTAELEAKGVRVMTYVNPYLVDVADDQAGAGAFTRNLYAEARDAGHLVKDAAGEPYVHVSGTFAAGLLDLTSEAAVSWFKDVLRDEVLGVGASGYMADFGEALPFDAVLASGGDPALEHNLWPERWAKLHRDVLEEDGLLGEVAFFSRSGYLKTAGLSTLFWAGDQMENWDEHDGMASGLTGLLSGGLSGISLNHTDVGGYTAYADVARTEELLLRWMEWSAFTAVFRSHEGNLPEVPQPYEGEAPLAHLKKFGDLFVSLASYRKALMKEASETGAPLVRHLLLEYPDDAEAWEQQREFMLGRDVLVAPTFAPGAETVSCYLPEGSWQHLFSGQTFEGPMQLEVAAPLGEPAVFYRAGSAAGDALTAALAP